MTTRIKTNPNMIEEARKLQKQIVDMRRHLHQQPELSYAEKETARLSADTLSQLGYTVKEGVGKTGVTGDLGSGTTIAIRADMDALPIDEINEVPYKSKNPGVMHACGHDAHVSIALAAARLLSENKSAGRIRVLMQPAEEYGDDEGRSGAYRMIEDGALKDVSAVIGLHVDASLPSGKVGILDGPIMAAVDGFTLKIQGKGGHGAYPETCIDAIVIGAQVVQAIQQIVSRRISALEPAIVTIGSFKSSSSRGNVIAEQVHMEGTFRSFSPEARATLRQELDRACSVARALGGDYELKYELGYPPTVNNKDIAAVMREAAIDLIGKERVVEVKPKTWSEDFSLLANVVPGAFMFFGVEIDGDTRSHHSPSFDINETDLYAGAAILAETARRLTTHLDKKG
ncbi:MAG: amidohydrolase [Candidatus Obscuribacterales bacterium]|nr:amidohydrolase [Candidatus Obscuribacterales bacterium]